MVTCREAGDAAAWNGGTAQNAPFQGLGMLVVEHLEPRERCVCIVLTGLPWLHAPWCNPVPGQS
jgi:hypothetical protein